MKSKRKWICNLLFVALVMGATAYGLFRNRNLEALGELLTSAAWGWWLGGMGLVVLFILGESLVLHRLLGTLRTPHRASHCALYSFVGFFVSCITPLAGGGQPAQVWIMKRDGIPGAVSVPVLMLVTITYKLVLVLYGAAVFLLRPPEIMAALEPVLGWCGLGMVLNVSFVGLYLLLVFRPNLVETVLTRCLGLWDRLSRRDRLERNLRRLRSWMGKYRDVGRCFRRHWGMIARVMGLTILQRTLLFAVTYLVMRSFGLTSVGLGTVAVLQAMISLGTDLLPLPGGMGASETMFLQIFPAVCSQSLVLPVLLVSRGISYYGQLLVSAVFTGLAVLVLGTSERKEKEHDRIL